MKKTTKVLLTLACAVLLIVASVMGTLAYLTDHDSVNNTFTVGQVHIKLDEAKVGTDGKALTGDAAKRVDNNTYHLLPGHEYDKDPTVTVLAGSEESYIKMVVTVNKTAELDKIFAGHTDIKLTDVIQGYDNTKWLLQGNGGEKDADGNRTYTFYYYKTVSALEKDAETGNYKNVILEDLFTGIKVPGVLTNDEIKTLQYKHIVDQGGKITWGDEEKLTIIVNAYAIQADGFNTADAAWAAFPTT